MKKIIRLIAALFFASVLFSCNNKSGNADSATPQKDTLSGTDTLNANKSPGSTGAQNAPTY